MDLVTPQHVASVLGLPSSPDSFENLEALIARGLPMAARKATLSRICPDVQDRTRISDDLSALATPIRRRGMLSADESAQIARLARVFCVASTIWKSESLAQSFLLAPHPLLASRTPLEVSMTKEGAARVEELLAALLFGMAA